MLQGQGNTEHEQVAEGRREGGCPRPYSRFATEDHTPGRVTPLPSNMTVQERYVTLLCVAEALKEKNSYQYQRQAYMKTHQDQY